MNIKTGLRSALLSNAAVAEIIDTRAYFKMLPQNPTYPALTLEQISGDPLNCVNEIPALSWTRIRINAWGETYSEADELAIAVETALNGQTFTLTGVTIGSIVADGMRDFYEPNVDAYYLTQDYKIFYKET